MPCAYRVWEAGSYVPGPVRSLDDELIVDRDLLNVRNHPVSGYVNAPRLASSGDANATLTVPQATGTEPLVFEGLLFSTLQESVPPPSEPWKVLPGELVRPGCVVRTPRTTLALVRQIHGHSPGAVDHLVQLPPARVVPRGSAQTVRAPAVILVGPGAVQVEPDSTGALGRYTWQSRPAYSVRLPKFLYHTELAAQLDALPSHAPHGTLEVPLHDAPLPLGELPVAFARVLAASKQACGFFPVLDDGQLPRLAFAYARPDGTTGVLLSDRQIHGWLSELARILEARSEPAPELPDARDESEPYLARLGNLETRSRKLGEVFDRVRALAASDLGLVMLGETGSGKEHLARAIHESSPRAAGPFVAVNCAVSNPSTLESQLFGHARGSFTGAVREHPGKFLEASGGTLLLDEIGDADAALQGALLRVLDTKRITPLGGKGERHVDVRVIAATCKPLLDYVADGRFRSDLYHRLAQGTVELPPLRERREDLPALCAQFLYETDEGAKLSPEAVDMVAREPWLGNVRQLRNALAAAVRRARFAKGGMQHREPVVVDVEHFEHVAAARAPSRPALPVVFPPDVKDVAIQTWRNGFLPSMGDQQRSRRRAHHRAVLLYLTTEYSRALWPAAMNTSWRSLFGEKWETTEEGRGMRELLAALGVDAKDEAATGRAREWVRGVVAGAATDGASQR